MQGSVLLLLLVVVCAVGMRHGPRAAGKMLASPASAMDLDAFEQLLVDKPDPARLREALYSLTRYPHVFGVANVVPQITAQMGASLQAFGNGSSVKVDHFTALSTLPLTRVVMLQANASDTPVSLDLTEACVPEDPTSCLSSITPLWGAYSPPTPNGQPTPYAPVVYANYCREEDYVYLEARGITVKDNIVLCRYGAIFRAQKAQFAEARGARGVLVYSDPIDDGYWAADQFPNGPARSARVIVVYSLTFFLSFLQASEWRTARNVLLRATLPWRSRP
jgi:N-acetylated-alpha-linked acidic dipeptidase